MARSTIIAGFATSLPRLDAGYAAHFGRTRKFCCRRVLWGVEGAIERAIGMFAFAFWRSYDPYALARARLIGIEAVYDVRDPGNGCYSLRN